MDFGFIVWLQQQFDEIHKENKNMANSLADLDAAIAALTQQQATLQTDVNTLVTAVDALIAKLQAGGDYTNEVAAVAAATAALQQTDSTVTTETGKAQGA